MNFVEIIHFILLQKNEENDIFSSFVANYQVSVSC